MPYSDRFKEVVSSTSAAEVPLMLIEITHPGLAIPVRLVDDSQDLVSNGSTYVACRFRYTMPDQREGQLPRARLTVDNIGKELVEWLELSGGGRGAQCRMMQVLRSFPNDIEWDVRLDLTNLHLDVLEVSGELGFEDLLNRPAIMIRYDPETAAGLF